MYMASRHPNEPDVNADHDLDGLPASRRMFLLMGLGLLATGCQSDTVTRVTNLPGPIWPDRVNSLPDADVTASYPSPRTGSRAQPPGGVLLRDQWSRGRPAPHLMNRMLPIRYLTVHHDGMDVFRGESRAAAAERLEMIRRSHRNRSWGDIGYHFIVDRGGRVWEGRPLMYQGAHVKDHNEGNIGVMCLGNFELQTPTDAQLRALNQYLTSLMNAFGVSMRNVRTHQEWAKTACPGRSLQRHMVAARSNRAIG